MKKAFTLVVLIVTPTMAFAQGTVVFENQTGLVRTWNSASDPTIISVPKGGGYVELIAAPAGTAFIPLISCPGGSANFTTLASFLAANPGWATVSGAITGLGNPVAGFFSGGTVTIDNIAHGASAEYTVIGWTGSAATFDAALATAGTSFGQTPMFTTGTGDPTATPPGTPVSLSATFTGMTFGGGCLDDSFMGFTAQPTNQTVVLGATATFWVGAFACPPPFYQWYFNGASIPGAAGGVVQISNVQLTNAGTYWVVLSNDAWRGPMSGPVYVSASATLTVLEPPNITHAPQDQTAYLGSSVSFQASATGTAPMAYLWLFNATNALSLGTNSVLTLTDVQPAQAGAYTVLITNAAGAVTSAPARVSVIPPVERRTVPGLVLRGQPGSVLNLEGADALAPSPAWATLDGVVLTNTSQWYFDIATPLPPQRFYRARQAGGSSVMPLLDAKMVPALTLTGLVGGAVRVDYINQFGPTDAWVTLGTVTLSSTSQLYFDVSAPGQPPRLYRLVQVP